MATYNFDLLDLADGESGDAAVSVVVAKKKADAAKPAEPAAQEKSKDFYYTKLQHDEGVRLFKQEQRRLRDVLSKLSGDETKLKEQPGNEAHLEELSDEQRKPRQEQSKLWYQEMELLLQKEDFYRANGMALSFNDYRYTKEQLDKGVRLCQQEVTRLREVLIKLRREETKLREQPGNEAHLEELSDEQRKLRQEQMKLREEELKLLQQKNAMVREYEEKPNNNSNGANGDSGSNYNGANGDVYNNNDGGSCDYNDYGGNND
ncbi:unnamed protein product [Urochloa humidicola]